MEAAHEELKLRFGDLSRVRDVVDAFMRLISSAHELSECVVIFNVASSAGQSLRSVVDEYHLCSKIHFNIEAELQSLRRGPIDIPSIVYDTRKLRDAIG